MILIEMMDFDRFEHRFEVWTTLTKLAKAHPEFSYHYLKRQKFPFSYKGWTFRKITPNVST